MRRSLIVLSLLLFAFPADAIVIRHDREDSLYRELADGFGMVGNVGGGMGTLVAPEWILTAGHVAESLAPGQQLRFGSRQATVEEIVLHPDYGFANRHRDLGLVRLTAPVLSIQPALLYEQDDEFGRQVTFVGDGYHGDGREGPKPGERVLRAAHNTVESVREGWITFRFDAPPDGDELEGISGPGDSGGPALVETPEGWAIMGVSAYNDGSPVCTYGSIEHYSRVSDELEWIRGAMDGSIVPDTQPRVMKFGTTEDGQQTVIREELVTVELDGASDTQVESTVQALAQSMNRGDRTWYKSLFSHGCIARTEAADDPVEGMLEFMIGAQEIHGPIVSFHELSSKAIDLPESKYPMRPVTFHLEDGTPGYFGLSVDTGGRIDHMSLFIQKSICEGGVECELAHSFDGSGIGE